MAFVESGGFFQQTFGQSPDPTSKTRPKGDLGPRYGVVYRVPGPNGGTSMLHQSVYPYASIGSVTYMPPGQSFFDGQQTHGGWFAGSPTLKATLVSAGLPESAPSGTGGGSRFERLDRRLAAALVALAAVERSCAARPAAPAADARFLKLNAPTAPYHAARWRASGSSTCTTRASSA